MGLLYYAAASSETLGDALDRAQRYSSIANESVVLKCFVSHSFRIGPAPGSEDTELGVLMELEVRHGEASVYAGVQA